MLWCWRGSFCFLGEAFWTLLIKLRGTQAGEISQTLPDFVPTTSLIFWLIYLIVFIDTKHGSGNLTIPKGVIYTWNTRCLNYQINCQTIWGFSNSFGVVVLIGKCVSEHLELSKSKYLPLHRQWCHIECDCTKHISEVCPKKLWPQHCKEFVLYRVDFNYLRAEAKCFKY